MATNKGTSAPATSTVDDAFDDATGMDFVRIADVDGRALVVWPEKIGQERGNDGKPYTYVQTTTYVLDGGAHEKFDEGDLIDLRFTTNSIVSQLEKSMKTGKPRLGRVSSVKSKFNTRAYALDPVDSNDPVRQKLGAALQAKKEDDARLAQAAVDDPFGE